MPIMITTMEATVISPPMTSRMTSVSRFMVSGIANALVDCPSLLNLVVRQPLSIANDFRRNVAAGSVGSLDRAAETDVGCNRCFQGAVSRYGDTVEGVA